MSLTFLAWIAPPKFSSAAPLPTPTPGAQTTLTAPVPDPLQFDWGPNQVVTHQALNSDFYGTWYEFQTLIGLLNATGAGAYACGPCVTSIVNGTGINATLGSQSAGVGTPLTIALSHGDYDDLSNAQTIAGAKTFSSVVTVASGYGNFGYQYSSGTSSGKTGIGAAALASVQGVTACAFEIANPGVSTFLTQDCNGNVGITGTIKTAGGNTCSSSSGLPCAITVSCSVTAASVCDATFPVPSGSIICSGSPNDYNGNSSLVYYAVETMERSVLTEHVTIRVTAATTATLSANVTCQ